MDILGALITLALLVGIVAFMFRGRLGGFNLKRAGRTSSRPDAQPWNSMLVTWLMAILASALGLGELANALGRESEPIALVILLGAAVGYALDSRLALFLLSFAGMTGAATALARTEGPESVVVVLLISALVLWLAGALRGVIQRG